VLYSSRSRIGEHLSCSSTGIQGYSSSKDYMGAGVVQGYRCTGVVQMFNGCRKIAGVQVTAVIEG